MISLPDDDGWATIDQRLDNCGFGVIPGLLDPDSCEELARGYASDHFRSTIAIAASRACTIWVTARSR